MLRKIFLLTFVLSGCTYSQSAFVCESGDSKDGAICTNGVWVSLDGEDLGPQPDGSSMDMSKQDDMLISDMNDPDIDDMPDVGSDMADLPPDPVCGNGLPETGEECDDGGVVPGDGCDANCMLEPTVCGNGILEFGEICDDGETDGALGFCNATCTGFLGEAAQCKATANNGRNTLFCDRNVNWAGASSFCQANGYELALMRDPADLVFWTQQGTARVFWWIDGTDETTPFEWRRADGPLVPFFETFNQIETGFDCAVFDSNQGIRVPANCDATGAFMCEARFCGNGTVDSATGETCDDGNIDDWDGCSSLCQLEVGFDCDVSTLPREATVCRQCGDGEQDALDQCDDNNDVAGDGCSDTCQIEPGAACSGYDPAVDCASQGAVVIDAERLTPATSLAAFGTGAGQTFSTGCASGFVIGVYAQIETMPPRISGIRSMCGEIDVRKSLVDIKNISATSPRIGIPLAREEFVFCPPGEIMVGYEGFTNGFGAAAGMQLYCAPAQVNGVTLLTGASAAAGSVGEVVMTTAQGVQTCPGANSALTTWVLQTGELAGRCREFNALCAIPDTCN